MLERFLPGDLVTLARTGKHMLVHMPGHYGEGELIANEVALVVCMAEACCDNGDYDCEIVVVTQDFIGCAYAGELKRV